MSIELVTVCCAVVASCVVSFVGVTRAIRRGDIRRAPRLSVARACVDVIRQQESDK